MIKFEFKYKGKKDDELGKMVIEGLADEIKEQIIESLKPLEKEISSCDGKIVVDISEDDKIGVELENMPDDLSERIRVILE